MSDKNKNNEDLNIDRRPNPPGWVPPRAPYNPYESTDQRPPEGYPSEFLPLGRPFPTSDPITKQTIAIAGSAVPPGYTLRRREFTPRPRSDLYPGQYKILKRLPPSPFLQGIKYAAWIIGGSFFTYIAFFVRWNDGYDNIFSPLYRFRLRMKENLGFKMTPQDYNDLKQKSPPLAVKITPGPTLAEMGYDISKNPYMKERPRKEHWLAAERIRQEQEEEKLKKMELNEKQLLKDIASGKLNPDGSLKVENSKKDSHRIPWYRSIW